MKKLLLILLLGVYLMPVALAQDAVQDGEGAVDVVAIDAVSQELAHPDIYADMAGNVRVHQDSAVTRLLSDLVNGAERENIEIQGFRVQVYSSNRQRTAKEEAYALEKRLLEADLQVQVYVQSTPPFWKVRLGDFRTKEEAALMKEEVLNRLPDLQGETYVVRDKIIVSK